MCVYVHLYAVTQRPEDSARLSGARVVVVSRLVWVLRTKLSPLLEQRLCLTAEPSLAA